MKTISVEQLLSGQWQLIIRLQYPDQIDIRAEIAKVVHYIKDNEWVDFSNDFQSANVAQVVMSKSHGPVRVHDIDIH